MLMWTLLAIAAVIVLFVMIVALQPKEMRVVRSATISAPPARVFPHVNELRAWEPWSPWAKIDPDCKITYEGPDAGVGSSMAWDGNKQVGAGKMTIVESRPTNSLRIKLEFLRPMRVTNAADFSFKPRGSQTDVEWNMTCQRNFLFKAFGLFCNMDKMIGKDFEKGLSQMKSVVESPGM